MKTKYFLMGLIVFILYIILYFVAQWYGVKNQVPRLINSFLYGMIIFTIFFAGITLVFVHAEMDETLRAWLMIAPPIIIGTLAWQFVYYGRFLKQINFIFPYLLGFAWCSVVFNGALSVWKIRFKSQRFWIAYAVFVSVFVIANLILHQIHM